MRERSPSPRALPDPASRNGAVLRLYEPIQPRTVLVPGCPFPLPFVRAVVAPELHRDGPKPVPPDADPGLAGGRHRVQHGILWPDIGASVLRIVLGFIISSAVAIPVGTLMGAYKVFEAGLEPPIDFMRYTPAVAFIPLTLIWFGTSTTQKLVILFIAIFFQEVLLVMDNVKNVPMPFVDMAYTLGLSQAQILRRVIFRRRPAGYRRHPPHLHGLGLDLPCSG